MRSTLVLAFFVCTSSAAFAQESQRGVDIELFRPALDGDGFLGIQGTTMPGPGQWNVGLWLNYSAGSLSARLPGGERADIIEHRLLGDFQVQVGLGSRVALGLDLPVLLQQSGQGTLIPDGDGALVSQAMGDPQLTARVRIIGRDATDLRERRDGPGVAALVSATLPLGSDDAFLGEGAVTIDLQGLADFRFLGLAVGVMLGYRHRFDPETIGGVVFRDMLMFGVGLDVPIPVVAGLGASLELRGMFDAAFASSFRPVIEGDIGLRFAAGALTLRLATGGGFTSGPGAPDLRVLFGVTWAPRAHDADADLDGIPDALDECPHLPEDFDGFEDEDGCSDPDNDNDFVPDADDLCPLEAAEEDHDEDEDGCTDR